VTRPWSVELVRVGAATPSMIRRVREDLVRILARAVWIAEETVDPAPAFVPDRRQYDVTALLAMVNVPAPPPEVIRIGITDVDLFMPVFTHVFGAAQLGGTAGITSCHRLRPQFEGDPPDPGLLRARLVKEVLHELGHALGLTHCRIPWCAMAASRLPEEVDLKDAAFCAPCARTSGVPADGLGPVVGEVPENRE